jgi:adenine-specific DNA-methyltransferase
MPILHWLNDEEARKTSSRVPYRLLEADETLSYASPSPSGEGLGVRSENMLIQGDNLEALKALLPYYAGQFRCIFIDPPYNTQSAFEHYDDNLEHSTWLSTLYPRLEILRDLLAEDGSIWVSIDDNESHYLKVMMDEIFNRKYFIAEIIWQKRTSRENRAAIGSAHDTILVYGKMEAKEWKNYRNLLASKDKGFSNPDNDSRGMWRSIPFTAQGYRPNQMYKITTPSGEIVEPPKGRCWSATEPVFKDYLERDLVYFPKNGKGRPRIKQFQGEEKGLVPMSLWLASDVGDTEASKKEILQLFPNLEPFGTPKPEKLLEQIITISSNENDLVLDSFLGSGTTAAVAHKIGRRYVGIEMGEHAVTYCVPRLRKVVDGEQGGISKDVNWQGGGGYHFYKLGEAIFDEEGKINPAVRFRALAAHVWFTETHTPLGTKGKKASALLGVHNGIAYYLLYNGILGEKSKDGGNVLTGKILASLQPHQGQKVIYGELTTFSSQRLARENILFKQVPYDIKAR